MLSYVNFIDADISRVVKFQNSSENKVLANKCEFTVLWDIISLREWINFEISILDMEFSFELKYRNDPKFSDRYTLGAVWSGSALFAIPSALFGLITLC